MVRLPAICKRCMIIKSTPAVSGCFRLSKNFYRYQKWGLGRSPKAGRRDASPRIHPPFRGKGGRGIGIINQKLISKTDFYYKLKAPRCVGVLLLCMFTAYCNSQDLSCHISLPQFRWKLLLCLFLQSCRPYKDTAFRRENRLYSSYRISSLYCPYQAHGNG